MPIAVIIYAFFSLFLYYSKLMIKGHQALTSISLPRCIVIQTIYS